MPSPFGNFFVKAIVNSPFHALLGNSLAVITVEGWKTGRRISTPINIMPVDDGWMVISMRKRTWWRNLRGGRPALLRLAGQQLAIRGEIIERRDEVIAGLIEYFRQNPDFVKYFDVKLGADGTPQRDGLEREAQKRVFIRLCAV
jgi:hypothetical protein